MKDLCRPLLIRASAGTGKTFQLSNRFIGLLLAGEQPDRILATTFTRKAAGEIRRRVFQRLAAAALNSEGSALLRGQLELDALSPEDCAMHLRRLAGCQHRLNICTLDSFFSRLALSFGFELGLVPGWSIAGEPLQREVRREAVRSVCNAQHEGGLLDLLRMLQKGNLRRSLQRQIDLQVADAFGVYQESDPAAWEWLPEQGGRTAAEVEGLVALLKETPLPLTKSGEVNRKFAGPFTKACSAAARGDWDDFIANGLVERIAEGGTDYACCAIDPVLAARVAPLAAQARAVLLNRLRRQTLAVQRLLELYGRAYRRQRERTRSLDFDDIKVYLSRAAVAGDLDELYYRLDTRISHLLLDEFQDTSTAEWRVLEPIMAEVLADAGGRHSFFCVGDVKQAIYGWRGGVAEIFDTLKARWTQIHSESIEQTRRCSQPVVTAVNAIFSGLRENAALAAYPEPAAAWQHRFHPHSCVSDSRGGYAVLEELQDQEASSFKRAAEIVRRLVDSKPAASVAVLLRTNRGVNEMMAALATLDVRASEEGGNPLTDSPAVLLLLSLLKLIDHPGDTISRFHVATSPLSESMGYSDFRDERAAEALSRKLRRSLNVAGYGAVIFEWARAISGAYNEREQHRLAQLVELSYSYEGGASDRTAGFIQFVETTKVDDPTSRPVRVMTIHQSKGLEFDAVVLPGLDFSLLRGPRDSLLVYRDHPLSPPMRISAACPRQVRQLEPALIEMQQQSEGERIKEALSVLYVAVTRARHGLYLVIEKRGERERKAALSYASLVHWALARTSESGFEAERPKSSGDGIRVLYEQGDPDWRPEAELKSEDGASSGEPAKPKLAPLAKRGRSLFRDTPSAREGGSSIFAADLLALDAAAAAFGTNIHALFEKIEWLDPNPPAGLTLPGGLELPDDFLRMLQQPEIQALLTRPLWERGTVQLFREYPFAVREGDTILSGSIDRLVVYFENAVPVAAEVVDFKTDRVPPELLEERAAYYRPQLDCYRRAAGKSFALNLERIRIKLAFVRLGTVWTSPAGVGSEIIDNLEWKSRTTN